MAKHQLTPEEKEVGQFKSGGTAVENGRKGGIASGIAKRQRKSMRELALTIANAPINQSDKKTLESLEKLGIDSEDATNNARLIASVYKSAVEGNMGAVTKWEQYTADTVNERKEFYLPAKDIGKAFSDINRQIVPNKEYIFKGGRGSGKSTYVAEKIVEIIYNNPTLDACVVRKVTNTLKDSVFATIKWVIMNLGLEQEFKFTHNPMEITLKATGQKIYFRGADDPAKLKSIKPVYGYMGILWFEEIDQMDGEAEVRNIEQSVLRGGDEMYLFKSFNPPKTNMNWMNKYVELPKDNMVVHMSDYRETPIEWLGQYFIDEAEHLKAINPDAYEHEYLGVPNGVSGNVFEYIEVRTIPQAEYDTFDVIYQGLDWGFFPDPLAFIRLYYDADSETIYLMDELYVNKWSNSKCADWILENGYDDYITICDSAEPKSINDLKDAGIPVKGAIKGAGSIEYGMKWMQIRKIVIDPERTPNALKEFINYEFERDKDDNFVSRYPDSNNHLIDATRYALERYANKRGTSA